MLAGFTPSLPFVCIPPFVYRFYCTGVSSGIFPRATYCFSSVYTVNYCVPFRACLFDALLLPAVLGLLGARSVVSLISQRQLCFAFSFSSLDPDALPQRVFALRLNSHGSGSVLSVWSSLLARYFLPSLSHIFVSLVSQSSWRRFIRSLLASYHHLDIVDGCSHLLLGRCAFSIGCVAPHWRVTLYNVAAARASLFRIQLLVGCGGLAVDSARFRGAVSSACPLCGSPREDAYHFAVAGVSPTRRYSRLLSFFFASFYCLEFSLFFRCFDGDSLDI